MRFEISVKCRKLGAISMWHDYESNLICICQTDKVNFVVVPTMRNDWIIKKPFSGSYIMIDSLI